MKLYAVLQSVTIIPRIWYLLIKKWTTRRKILIRWLKIRLPDRFRGPIFAKKINFYCLLSPRRGGRANDMLHKQTKKYKIMSGDIIKTIMIKIVSQSLNAVYIHPKIGSRATPSKRSSPRKTPSKRQQQVVTTPTKTATLISEEFRQEFELRRSPRKHAGSPATPATMIKAPVGYSTLKISGQ